MFFTREGEFSILNYINLRGLILEIGFFSIGRVLKQHELSHVKKESCASLKQQYQKDQLKL